MRKGWALLAGLFVVLGPVLAQASTLDPRIQTVKVTSRRCDGIGSTFKGSGILVRLQGKTFVMTSEHVFFHANEGYCHRIGNAVIGDHLAMYAWASYSEGYAFLSVPRLVPQPEWQDLANVDSDELESDEAVTLLGYPYAMDEPIEVHGRIAPEYRERREDLTDRLSVIAGAYAEFGMSGGPFFEARTGKFAGLITHIRKGADGKLQVLGINRAEISRRVVGFSRMGFAVEPWFWQDPEAQLAPDLTIIIDRYRFVFRQYKPGLWEADVSPQMHDSRGRTIREDRWFTSNAVERAKRGEDLSGESFVEGSVYHFGQAMEIKLPKSRRARIRKLVCTERCTTPGEVLIPRGWIDIPHLIMSGAAHPIYEP